MARPSLDSFVSAKPQLDSFVNQSAAPMSQPTDTNLNGSLLPATFPATGNETPLEATGKVLGNIPSSAVNFGKNVIDFFNPLKTIKTAANIVQTGSDAIKEGANPVKLAVDTVKGLPEAAYKSVVPQFLQHIVAGDYDKAAATIENDPVGQIAPLLLLGRQAAEKAGKGAEFDQAMTTVAKPVTVPVKKAAIATGNIAAQTLGAATGAGAASVKEAFHATPAFTDAMRGKIDPESVVGSAQDAVQTIADNRRQEYLTKLDEIGKQSNSLDISPVHKTLQNQLVNFGVKVADDGSLDFSRSSIANNGSARTDVQGVYDTLKDWGNQPGDRTPVGIDTLKKQLADFYSPSGSARALVQSVKSQVSDILNKQVPGYQEMTGGYAKASQLLDDIKSATGAGGKAKVDTVFTKMTSALKSDKELRLEVMKTMQSEGAQPDLMAKIAGTNMQSYIPKGLVGKGVDVGAAFAVLGHFFNPSYIPMLLGTSPRVVGEFVRALGMGAAKTNAVLKVINNVHITPASSLKQGQVPTPQSKN